VNLENQHRLLEVTRFTDSLVEVREWKDIGVVNTGFRRSVRIPSVEYGACALSLCGCALAFRASPFDAERLGRDCRLSHAVKALAVLGR